MLGYLYATDIPKQIFVEEFKFFSKELQLLHTDDHI
jgi:hypothetical protein